MPSGDIEDANFNNEGEDDADKLGDENYDDNIIDTNKALSLLGNCNTWQLSWYFVIALIKNCVTVCSTFAFLFPGAEPPRFHCKVPMNISINESIPMEKQLDGSWQLSKCQQYHIENGYVNQSMIEPCQNGYTYYPHFMITTIVSEWNLVCDKEWLAALTSSAFFAMSFIGALIFSRLVDSYGRRFIFLIMVLLLSLINILTAFLGNVWLYLVARIFAGAFQQGCYVTGFCFCVELFPIKLRTAAGIIDQCFWVIGAGILTFILYFVRDWRMYFIWTSVPFLATMPLLWFMPESIPWLVAQGKEAEARKHLQNASRSSNKKNMFKNVRLVNQVDNQSSVGDVAAKYTVTQFWRTPFLGMWMLGQVCLFFSTSSIYYASGTKVVNMGNPLLNFFLSNLVEIPAYFLILPIMYHFGRRIPLNVCFIITGVTYFSTAFIMDTSLKVTMLLISRFAIAACFAIIFLYVTEMFPTTLRTTATGIASSVARIGATLAPFVMMMDKSTSWAAVAFYTPFAILSAVVSLLLPETVHRKLPQSVEELQEWKRRPGALCRMYNKKA